MGLGPHLRTRERQLPNDGKVVDLWKPIRTPSVPATSLRLDRKPSARGECFKSGVRWPRKTLTSILQKPPHFNVFGLARPGIEPQPLTLPSSHRATGVVGAWKVTFQVSHL